MDHTSTWITERDRKVEQIECELKEIIDSKIIEALHKLF